jgi:hypothetical protein
MADLTNLEAAQTIKIVGATSAGVETNAVDATLNGLKVDGSAVVHPVSQSGTWNINDVSGTVSLPTGASTSALQTTGNTSLSNIDGKLNSLGQKTSANSMPVVIASDQVATPGTPNTQALTVQNAQPATYSSSITALVLAANPTDAFTITGSGTKSVRIKRIIVTVTTSSGSAVRTSIQLLKRSTANTGGTSTIRTAVPHLTANAAATAEVRAYTANPTLGTLVGTIRSAAVGVQQTGTFFLLDFDFNDGAYQPFILTGTSEVLAVNFNAVSITGSVVGASVEWVEV